MLSVCVLGLTFPPQPNLLRVQSFLRKGSGSCRPADVIVSPWTDMVVCARGSKHRTVIKSSSTPFFVKGCQFFFHESKTYKGMINPEQNTVTNLVFFLHAWNLTVRLCGNESCPSFETKVVESAAGSFPKQAVTDVMSQIQTAIYRSYNGHGFWSFPCSQESKI